MSTLTFNTLKFTKRLETGGMPRDQAEAFAEAYQEALGEAVIGLDITKDQLATKSDLNVLRSDLSAEIASVRATISQLETKLVKAMGVGFVTTITVLGLLGHFWK